MLYVNADVLTLSVGLHFYLQRYHISRRSLMMNERMKIGKFYKEKF